MKIVIVFLFFLIFLSACNPEAQNDPGGITYGNKESTEAFEVLEDDFETEIDPQTLPTREPNSCPNLDSQLYQLTQSDDASTLAAQMGWKIKDDKVQVVFLLENEDSGFLLAYDVEIGTQSGNQVQAYAAVDQLCDLANLEAILAIRPVNKIY
jgi:hypothetical protein